MKRLARNEEVKILKELMKNEGNYLGRGSSRVVFDYTEDLCVKVAFDKKGQFQNHTEIETFEANGNDFLAEISSFGKYIVVMEKVEPFCMDEVSDAIEYLCYGELYDEDFEPNFSEQESESLLQVKQELDYMLGETEDNLQLGLTSDYRIVAYDYGLQPDNHDKSVSNKLWRFFMENENEKDFLKLVMSKLLRTS